MLNLSEALSNILFDPQNMSWRYRDHKPSINQLHQSNYVQWQVYISQSASMFSFTFPYISFLQQMYKVVVALVFCQQQPKVGLEAPVMIKIEMFIYEEILQTRMAYLMRSSLVCAWQKVYLNTRLLIVASYNANKFYANIADTDPWLIIN